MNINKLVALVNGPSSSKLEFMLSFLSENWVISKKAGNPIVEALEAYKSLRIAQVCKVVSWTLLFFALADILVLPLLGAFIIGMTFAIYFYRDYRRKSKNARAFCLAISLLESKIGSLTRKSVNDHSSEWYREKHWRLTNVADAILAEAAEPVKKFQAVAWQKKEADKARQAFGNKMTLLCAVTGKQVNWSQFLPKKA